MFGAIDIGTNSVRLLITDNNLQVKERVIKTTRLGEGVNQNKFLLPEACFRTLSALSELKKIAENYDLQYLPVVATSAVRDAVNRDFFLNAVQDRLGLLVDVLTGEREAYLTYLGVTADFISEAGKIVVFDLGGGSTEIILGQDKKILELHSLDIGAVRMTERFLATSNTEYNCSLVKEFTRNLLHTYLDRYSAAGKIIGVGGTATSLAALQQRLVPYDSSKVHGFRLGLTEVKNIRQKLALMSVAERSKLPGLQPKRADVILGGVLVVETLLEELQMTEFTVSENDLLLGLIIELS